MGLRIGNYGRKSIFSDKSDSVENQYKINDDYAHKHFDVEQIYYYGDDGVTGENLDRPDYQRLFADIEMGLIDVVIVYKIDRISRDVDDFSTLFKYLSSHGVIFVSVTDNIDTTNQLMPIEKAMMFMSSVFSQFERETTVQRVTDNMIKLAEGGYWAGGAAPTGLLRVKVEENGKKHTILAEDPESLPFLNMVADTFLGGNYSLNGLERYFRENGIKTLQDKYLSSTQIFTLLKNPHYAPADSLTYDYFKSLGCRMAKDREDFDGKHGLIVYGRTKGGRKKTHTVQPPDKWVVSVGRHAPVWTSEKYLQIQAKFGHNKIDKTRKHYIGILKGVVKCKCGYSMRVQHKVDKTYNKTYDNYFCQLRNRRDKTFCDVGMVRVDDLDGAVMKILKSIALDRKLIDQYTAPMEISPITRDKANVKKEIDATARKISNLTAALSDSQGSVASKYIIAEIETYDKRLSALNVEFREISLREQRIQHVEITKDMKYKAVCDIVDKLDTADYEEINGLLKDLLIECVWNGETLKIKL